jgi:NAD-dependent SIR2 family protein deacetylase
MVDAVVSTNVDDLHMRSGVLPSHLAELHRNSYLEICEKCNTPYLRKKDI